MSRTLLAVALAIGLTSSTVAHAQSSACCCCCSIVEGVADDLLRQCFDATCGVVIDAMCDALCAPLNILGRVPRVLGAVPHAHTDHVHPPHVVVAAAPSDAPMAY